MCVGRLCASSVSLGCGVLAVDATLRAATRLRRATPELHRKGSASVPTVASAAASCRLGRKTQEVTCLPEDVALVFLIDSSSLHPYLLFFLTIFTDKGVPHRRISHYATLKLALNKA